MKLISGASCWWRRVSTVLVLTGAAVGSLAQQPAARIGGDIDASARVALKGSEQPLAKTHAAAGRVPASTQLTGMHLDFTRTAEQEAALKALIEAQQTSGSAQYHQWLTPEQFASEFGLADADIARVEAWLETQGFKVVSVANSKNRITFSGTAAQAEAAFGTELNYYTVGTTQVFAPSTALSLPSALGAVVGDVGGLSNLRPRAHHARTVIPAASTASAKFTSSETGDHYLTPGDIDTIYDITAAHNAGYTGSGQSIAVVGQSAVELSDIENFQTAAGLTVKDPTLVLVPNSGTSETVTGDETESDLDLEYSGAIATGATIYFVYTGNSNDYDVWNSVAYAVDTKIAPIISTSYGECEPLLTQSGASSLDGTLEQATSQGQTVVAAAGDDGSSDCWDASKTLSVDEQLAVDYPGSSVYSTAIGGTEFLGDVANPSTYWNATSGSDLVSSAKAYISEEVWNDDSVAYTDCSNSSKTCDPINAGGGGASSFFNKPSWQTALTPGDGARDTPDIALDASNYHDGYIICSSDNQQTGLTADCTSGFRGTPVATNDTDLAIFGGTSFGAPIFSGMLAIINQKLNSTGQGSINSTLYTLAGSSTTYASAFHDITSGSNECTISNASYCSGTPTTDYAAAAGYDRASGLGSVDFNNLITAWPASVSSGSSLAGSTTTLTAAASTPAASASDLITITVASSSSTETVAPTGTLTVVVDGTTETSTLARSTGAGTYGFSSATTGAHTIVATYSGDANYAPSTGSLVVTVGGSTTTPVGSFTLAATSATISQGSSGTSTVTVTSANSYAGTVDLTISSTSGSSLQTYGCYDVTNPTLTANSTASATITIYTAQSACESPTSVKGAVLHHFVSGGAGVARNEKPGLPAGVPLGAAAAMAGALCLGLGRRRKMWAALSCLVMLVGLGVSIGCGGGTSTTPTPTATDVAKGTYTVTVNGDDSVTKSINATTTFTLTVD